MYVPYNNYISRMIHERMNLDSEAFGSTCYELILKREFKLKLVNSAMKDPSS